MKSAERMRIVICPGLPRSGTTYLYKQLAEHNADIFNRPKLKEINAFNRSLTPTSFKEFFETSDDERYYLDFSPSYLIARIPTIDNALSFDAEKKFIFNIRHPVEQIYAHYLHDLKAHYASMEMGVDVWRPLLSREACLKYLSMHASAIERIVSTVGRRNILAINFHRDLAAPIALTQKVGKFLDVPLKEFSSERVGRGGWLPYYIYGGADGVDYAVGTEIFIIPPRTLILVNGSETAVWPDTDPGVARRLIEGASSWTRYISREQCDVLYSGVRCDWEKVLNLLDLDPAEFELDGCLEARIPDFPISVARKNLRKLGDLATRVSNCCFSGGVGIERKP